MSKPTTTCASSYTAWTGLTLRCTGEHLRGNIFKGEVHQQSYGRIAWTWYDEEADETGSSRPTRRL